MVNERGTFEEFIDDITPFFYGKRLTYVDIGAYIGETFLEFNSKLNIRESHLFEPNPDNFSKLEENISNLESKNTHLYNKAIGENKDLILQKNLSMSKVINDDSLEHSDCIKVDSISLDSLVNNITENHISILKVDVEGYEKEVLLSAESTLENQQVDILYIEAGVSPDNKQQTYYRNIDDIMISKGYNLFRIYEQMFEWIDDSPKLRRINLAYISDKFAKQNPFRVVNELFELKEKYNLLSLEYSDKDNENQKLSETIEEKDNENQKLSETIEEKENQNQRLSSEFEVLKNKNNDNKKKLQILDIELGQVKSDVDVFQDKLERTKQLLTFKLGHAITSNSHSITQWFKIPFALYKAKKEFNNEKTLINKSRSNNDCNIKKNSKAINYPKPMKSAIIWQANNLINDGHVNEGIDFAKKYAKGLDSYTIELLKANRDIKSPTKWLKRINEYLKQFKIEPIQLYETNKNNFFNIYAKCNYAQTDGPLVSIIMPAFNAESFIEHSVNSLINQTWKNIEIIIVDDCSTDNTLAKIKELSKIDSRIKYLKNICNVGPYVSKNYALDISSGEYITGHDADDWAHPQRIENQVKYMVEHQNVKATITKMIRMDKNGKIVHLNKIGKTSDDGATRLASISTMFQSSFLKDTLGYWDSVKFGADSEMISRAEKILGENFVVLRQLSMICLDIETSLTNDPNHGVSKTTGISDSRKFYRDQWMEWHKSIDLNNAYMTFPHSPRKFNSHPAGSVKTDDILLNLNSSTLY
ncbi:MAG: FkbM family methyltransferase [Campylobacterota bacterium]|nr:FkbM family methyltransferase [Campylobacterota bacterium]